MASQYPPKRNTAFTLYFTLYKNDGTIIANPGTITKKVSIDGAAVADITAAVTEEDTTYGQCSIVLAAGEMNGDAIWVYIADDTSGCVPFTCTIYTAGELFDTLVTNVATIDGIVDDILVDTGTTIPGTITTLQGNVTDILTDTGTTLDALIKDVPTVAEFEARTLVAADYVVVTDTLAGVTLVGTCTTNTDMRGTDNAALASVCTETRLAELDAANLPADVAAVKAETASILTDTAEIGAAGAGLTAVPWNAAWDAEVQSECADALNAYDPPTKAELDTAVANVSVDEIQATAIADLFNTDSGTTYAAAVAGSAVKEIADNAGGASLTVQDIVDGVWDEVLDTAHEEAGSASVLLQGAGTAGDPWLTALPGEYGAGTAGKMLSDVLVDTGTTLDGKLDAIAVYIDTEIAAILSDTDEIQGDLANGGRLDLLIDAIKAKTDVIPASPAAVGSQMDLVNAPNAVAVTAIQNGLATPTNITAGTITTVTNLTNAPTSGDFTATMKTSLNAATPASVQNIAADGSGLTALGDARLANLDAAVSTRLAPAGTLARVTLTDTCTTNTDMRGTDNAALAAVCTEGRLAELDAANLPTDVAAVPTTAEIKTAIEAAGSLLDLLAKANVYKLIINETTGAAEMFDAAGTSLGTVAAAFTSDAGVTTRKKMVP